MGIRLAYLRDKIKQRFIELRHVPTSEQTADLLTKSTCRRQFESLVGNLCGLEHPSGQKGPAYKSNDAGDGKWTITLEVDNDLQVVAQSVRRSNSASETEFKTSVSYPSNRTMVFRLEETGRPLHVAIADDDNKHEDHDDDDPHGEDQRLMQEDEGDRAMANFRPSSTESH